MRSTMTRYPEGSPIFVPLRERNSAPIPCARPSVLTRSRNAGGNEYSRPHNRPTFIVISPLPPSQVRLRRLLDAVARLVDDRLHHGAQIARPAIDLDLLLSARAVADDLADVLDFPAAAKIVDHIVDKFEQLAGKLAHRHLAPLAEVDQLAVDAPAGGAPLVLFDQRAMIAAEPEIAFAEPIQLDDDRLRERGDGDRRARGGRHVADTELERPESRLRPQIPPDLLAVVDAVQLDELLDVLLVFAPR